MATDVGGSQGALRNIVARLRQRRSGAVRSAQQQAPEVARLQAAMEMHELGVRLYRQRMHREHPGADRADIDRMVKAWLGEPPHSGGLRIPSRERGRDIR
jgi:hypothetical protein